jgi:TonB-linked SusC/RagA family outer membrane protein
MPTGSPVQDFSPMIRGEGSIGAGGSALVLIDGVPGKLNTLNPADIKDITVLKDAAASAIYGARGAFGVVLVTTKSPKSGQVRMDYSVNYSLNKRAVKPHLLTNGYLWAKNFDEAYYQWSHSHPTTVNTGMTFSQDYLAEYKKLNDEGALPKIDVDPSTGKYVYYGSTDWQKLLFDDNDPSMEHRLSISGGSKDVKYYMSGREFTQHGIYNYSPDKFKMYNFRGKGSVQVFPWLNIGDNFFYSQRSYFNPLSVRSPGTNILRRLTDEFNPMSFLQNPDGTLTKSAALTFGSFLTGGNFQKEKWQEMGNTFDFEAGFLKDALKINGNFSYINRPYLEEQQATPLPYSEKPGEILIMDANQDYSGETTYRENYMGANLYASYQHAFKKHFLKAMVGYNYENTNRIIRHYRRNGMINPDLPDPGLLTGSDIQLTGGGYEWTTSGEFFRLNYNYNEKYLVEINGRYDGSSKFPLSQQFGFFPSISAGWRISNESFWKVSPNFISNLKIRGSYGSLGNGNVSPYQYLETMPVNILDMVIQGMKPIYTNDPNVIPNGLTWERSTTSDIGLDAGFLSNRLSLNFDYYVRKTTGMFTQGIPLPGTFGASVPKGNYADMKTPGWELTLSWHDQSKSSHPIRYNVRFTLADNYSVVTRFNNPQGLIEEFYEGKRLGDEWGYKIDGLYKTEQELANAPDQTKVYVTSRFKDRLIIGDLKFRDINGDGKIDYGALTLDNHGDLAKIGNTQPRYLFGFNGNVEWNNFDLSVFFQGIGKRDWWPGSENWLFWGQFNRPYTSMPVDVLNQIWSPDNPNGYFPNLVGYEANNDNRSKAMNSPSDYFLQNAAYIRLKNLSIGYSLPHSLISKIKLKQARIYFSGQNLWVWSPMYKIIKTIDPEAIGSQADSQSETRTYLMSAIESNKGSVYPILKTFTLGADITF